MFNELRQLSQAIIQNGGTLYDVIELYSTKSMRAMKKTFKDLRDKQVAQQEQAQQLEQQKLEQQQQQSQAQLQQAAQQAEAKLAHDDYQNELDRINKKEIALIAAESKVELPDVNNNMTPDVAELSKISLEQSKAQQDYQTKMHDIQSKNSLASQKLQVEREKIQVARENQANDLAVAKENAKGRNTNKKK
jgi:hypothetical protein